MQRSLIMMIRIVGLRTVYALMAMVIPFYMIFNRKGYSAMKDYFKRHHGSKGLRTVIEIYRNHYVFGQVILDRFAAYGGLKFAIEVEGMELFDTTMTNDTGVILLSSHVGNYELAGYTLLSDKKRFNALVFGGETETVMQNRSKILAKNHIRMIPAREDMSHIFQINAAIENGEIVSIPADRVYGSSKTIECDFMGAKALFPMGAFAVAAQKEVPALAIFVMKEGTRRYRAQVRQIAAEPGLTKKGQMAAMAQRYATELSDILHRYPYQWFNYYNFWQH